LLQKSLAYKKYFFNFACETKVKILPQMAKAGVKNAPDGLQQDGRIPNRRAEPRRCRSHRSDLHMPMFSLDLLPWVSEVGKKELF
jgi:hypothetical protein